MPGLAESSKEGGHYVSCHRSDELSLQGFEEIRKSRQAAGRKDAG